MIRKRNFLYIFVLMLLCETACFAAQEAVGKKSEIKSDREILLKNNAYVFAPVLAVGFLQWDWGRDKFHSKDEGFFQENSRYGGADKMGHFYSSYLISELLAKKFIVDGIAPDKAALYGASSSFVMTSLIELGDATAKEHGFSSHDQVMNTVGALASYALLINPNLDKKIDFKVDYIPTSNPFKSGGRLIDDYDGARYIASLKLSGFDFSQNNFLRFIELQTSYQATGYINRGDSPSRKIGFGVALNIAQLIEYFFDREPNKYLAGFFDYYQPRYTYIAHDKGI